MKNKKQLFENIVHGIFLILGLIAVACVLMITIYLVISGIPAIREIGLVPFLFGTTWASTAAEPSYGILPFIRLRHRRRHRHRRAHRLPHRRVSGQDCAP